MSNITWDIRCEVYYAQEKRQNRHRKTILLLNPLSPVSSTTFITIKYYTITQYTHKKTDHFTLCCINISYFPEKQNLMHIKLPQLNASHSFNITITRR